MIVSNKFVVGHPRLINLSHKFESVLLKASSQGWLTEYIHLRLIGKMFNLSLHHNFYFGLRHRLYVATHQVNTPLRGTSLNSFLTVVFIMTNSAAKNMQQIMNMLKACHVYGELWIQILLLWFLVVLAWYHW